MELGIKLLIGSVKAKWYIWQYKAGNVQPEAKDSGKMQFVCGLVPYSVMGKLWLEKPLRVGSGWHKHRGTFLHMHAQKTTGEQRQSSCWHRETNFCHVQMAEQQTLSHLPIVMQ